MSTESESREKEMGLNLDVHFLPAWAQQSATANKYSKFEGGGDDGRDDRRRDPHNRRTPPRPGGGGVGGGGGRPQGQGFGGPRPGGGDRRGGPGGPSRDGGRRPSGPGGPRRDDRGGPRDRDRGPQVDRPVQKPLEIDVNFVAEERGVDSLARQIKLTGRAYPLFEIAYLILKKADRYQVQLISNKDAEGKALQPIFICGLDDTLWISEQDVMNHILDKHFGTFYSTEKIATDAPKGTYTFVAQCGISGAILGPPNYHDYQAKLHKLHTERFGRMPFDMFKARIKIVRDEAVVKKWLEDQSFRTEFTALNIPDTIKFNNRAEVEKHFREVHLANVVKVVDSYTLSGTTAANMENRALQSLIRRSYDDQMRFPLKLVNNLSQQFARQGLQFFKVNKSITHVAVARPHYLDIEATPVSDSIKRIVQFIQQTQKCTRRKLFDALAPGASSHAATAPATVQQPAAAPEGTASPEGSVQGTEGSANPPAPASAPVTAPEIEAINSDLHWLIHQGHVIEFANGILETAKRPLPRPPKAEKKEKAKAPANGDAPATETPAAEVHSEGEVTTDTGVDATEGSEAEQSGDSAPETIQDGASEQKQS